VLRSIILVGIGGFIGSVARYLTAVYLQTNNAHAFPWGTFLVNITGSLLIGLFYGLSERGNLLSPEVRLMLVVGFCGGFTTFSSLTNEAYTLLQGNEWLKLSLYTALSFFLGLLAVFIGRSIIKIF